VHCVDTSARNSAPIRHTGADSTKRRCVLGYLSSSALGSFLQSAGSACETVGAAHRHDGLAHPDTLTSVSNLAGCMLALGNAAEALPLCRRALESSERVLGAKHPTTQTTSDRGCPADRARQFRAKRALPALKRSTAKRQGPGRVAKFPHAMRQIVHANQRKRMLGAEHTLTAFQIMAVNRQRQGTVAHLIKAACQTVRAVDCFRMACAEHAHTAFPIPSVERQGLGEVTHRSHSQCHIVQAGDSRVIEKSIILRFARCRFSSAGKARANAPSDAPQARQAIPMIRHRAADRQRRAGAPPLPSGQFRGQRYRAEQGRLEAPQQHHQGLRQRDQILTRGFRCQRAVAEIRAGNVDAGRRDQRPESATDSDLISAIPI
jgi:hypothetical protein